SRSVSTWCSNHFSSPASDIGRYISNPWRTSGSLNQRTKVGMSLRSMRRRLILVPLMVIPLSPWLEHPAHQRLGCRVRIVLPGRHAVHRCGQFFLWHTRQQPAQQLLAQDATQLLLHPRAVVLLLPPAFGQIATVLFHGPGQLGDTLAAQSAGLE